MAFIGERLCKMNYHTITYPDQNNGDGLRVVLWLSGCNHHCKHCQNPQTWNPDSGIKFDGVAKEELFRELEKDYISGITFTGGDPLHENNVDEVLSLVYEIKDKYPNKTIWLYSGYTLENTLYPLKPDIIHVKRSTIIKLSNVFIDGEYIEALRDITLKWRGSKNQRVIDVQESLKQNKVVLHCD